MKHRRIISAASAITFLIAISGLAAMASQQQDAGLDELRQKQIEDLTLLVADLEKYVDEQKARAEMGLAETLDAEAAELKLARTRTRLVKLSGTRAEWIARLRAELVLAERLAERWSTTMQSPDRVDPIWSKVTDSRAAVIDVRQRLINALEQE